MQPIPGPLLNQFLACASRRPAEAGNRFVGRAGHSARSFGRSERKTDSDRWSSARSLRCGGAFSNVRHWNSTASAAVRRAAAATSTNRVSARPVFERVPSALPLSCYWASGWPLCPAGQARLWVGSSCRPSSALPNHSLKLSTNGGPPGPAHSAVRSILWPGPGVPPLAPA